VERARALTEAFQAGAARGVNMARVDWAVLCELAFLDRQDRLCVVGIITTLPVPRLPIVVTQLMMVVRLDELKAVEEIQVAAAVVSPSGIWTTPSGDAGVSIEMAREYVLATLRSIPIREEGVHSFRMLISGQPPLSVDIPVMTVPSGVPATMH
jgi:hypothetical protein